MSRPADEPGVRPGHYRPRPQGYRRPPGTPAGGPATGPTRRMHAVGSEHRRHGPPTGGLGRAGPGAQHGNRRPDPRWRRARTALVGVARVLAGGMVVLVLVVLCAPLVLGGPGAGASAIVSHAVAAVIAVAATGVAAHRRLADPIAVVAALVVPVTLLVLLSVYWWS